MTSREFDSMPQDQRQAYWAAQQAQAKEKAAKRPTA